MTASGRVRSEVGAGAAPDTAHRTELLCQAQAGAWGRGRRVGTQLIDSGAPPPLLSGHPSAWPCRASVVAPSSSEAAQKSLAVSFLHFLSSPPPTVSTSPTSHWGPVVELAWH